MKKLKKALFALGICLCAHTAVANTAATQPANHSANQTNSAASATTAKSVAPKAQQYVVNINTASAAEIQDKLNGIGAKKAQAIVEYREKHGKFVNIEQLTEVPGIGKATLDKNRDRLVIE